MVSMMSFETLPPILTLPIVTTLANGLRIATLEFPKEPFNVCLTIGCGSRFDPDESPGISSAIYRRAKLIDMGYSFDREVTSAIIMAEGKDIVEPLKLLGDFARQTGYFETANMLAPSFTKPGEEKLSFVLDKLREVAFKNNPLGRFPTGPDDSKITKEQIERFVLTHYTAPRTVVTITGDTLKHDKVVEDVKKFFMHLPNDPTTFSQMIAKSLATFTSSEVRMPDEEQSLATFAIAFRGASTTDADCITLQVIEKMIGYVNLDAAASGTEDPDDGSSELAKFVKINKLANYMGACSDTFHETGLFCVYASAEPHCLDELAKAIMSTIGKLSCHVREADVDRACEQLRTSFKQEQRTKPVAVDIGEQIIKHGRRIRFHEVSEKIKLVDVAEVKRVADRFFFDKDIAIVAMGPIKKLPDYDWFRTSTCSCKY